MDLRAEMGRVWHAAWPSHVFHACELAMRVVRYSHPGTSLFLFPNKQQYIVLNRHGRARRGWVERMVMS